MQSTDALNMVYIFYYIVYYTLLTKVGSSKLVMTVISLLFPED